MGSNIKSVYIKSLSDLTKDDKRDFGSKAVNLGIMIRAGINVPKGYCLSQHLYDEAMQPDGTISLPDSVVSNLRNVYEMFNHRHLAVRSSSSLEDSESNSFAGLYETYLNVTTFEDMINSIEKCMLSANQERVEVYYQAKTEQKKKNRMAVIIQNMVDSRVAGVLFMANPLNNRHDQIMINGSWGLGEAIVDGEVSPDQWIVDKVSGKIIRENIMEKLKMTISERKGVTLKAVGQEMKLKACLNREQVKKLIAVARKVQGLFQLPQDIEWAYDGSDFYIVQSRAITTLYPIDQEILKSRKLRLYICYNTAVQGIIEPFTPLGYEFNRANLAGWTSIYYSFKKKDLYPSWVKKINGRLHYDLTEMIGKKFYAKNLPKGFETKDPVAADLLRQIIDKYGDIFFNQGGKFKLSWGLIKWGMSLSKYAKLGKDTTKALKDAIKMGDDFVSSVSSRIKKAETIAEKIRLMEDVAEECLTFAFTQAFYCNYGMKAVEKHDKWIEKHYPSQFDLESIRKVLPNNPTTTMGIELSKIAKRLSETGKDVTVDNPLIVGFLRDYGHRGDIEMDIGTKRWKDDPRYILNLIESYMIENRAAANLERIEKSNQRALDTIEDIYRKVKKDKGEKKAKAIRYDYLNYRTLAGLRERPKFDVIRAMDLIRDMVLEIGKQLQLDDALLHFEDISFLTFEQILKSDRKKLKSIVKKEKAKYYRQMQATAVPRCILSTGECFYHTTESETPITYTNKLAGDDFKQYFGTPISKGIYKGRVRVLHSPVDVDIEKGDIIVTHNTNPAWTPLFLVAGALVMESGGPMSHGAVVAREYGIPAVAGIVDALKLLKDGEIVIVNGAEGTVKICNNTSGSQS